MSDPATALESVSFIGIFLRDWLGIQYWALAPGAAGALVGLAFSPTTTRFRMAMMVFGAMLAAGYLSQVAYRLAPQYIPALSVMADRNLMSLCAFVIGLAAKMAIPILMKKAEKKMEKINE